MISKMLVTFLVLLIAPLASAQRVEWREDGVERTQTLSFDLAFGEEFTLITAINAADLEMRALATHSVELVDGTVMAAILRTQPKVRIANSGGAFVDWQSDARMFQKLGVIEEDDFALTISMPAIEGADFVPNLKIEFVLRPITPESEVNFLDQATLSSDVRGSGDYGLAALQAGSLYPDVDMDALVTLRAREGLSMAREGGPCRSGRAVRTMFATLDDLTPEKLADQSNFPQGCWSTLPEGLRAAAIAEDPAYQPDIRVRLGENSGELIGFVYGATTDNPQRIFIQNTSAGWLYSDGVQDWARIGNGTRTDVPFGEGILAIRNPKGGETEDATENDAFVTYLVN